MPRQSEPLERGIFGQSSDLPDEFLSQLIEIPVRPVQFIEALTQIKKTATESEPGKSRWTRIWAIRMAKKSRMVS